MALHEGNCPGRGDGEDLSLGGKGHVELDELEFADKRFRVAWCLGRAYGGPSGHQRPVAGALKASCLHPHVLLSGTAPHCDS